MSKSVSESLVLHSPLLRKILAEFIGTALLIIIGNGSVAQSVLSNGMAGQALSIHIAWGLAVMIAVQVVGGVSGHINPSITLAHFALRRIRLIELILFVIAQHVGAFLGAAIVYVVYFDSLEEFDSGQRQVVGPMQTAQIFATYPKDYLTILGGLLDQIIGTLILSIVVFAMTDPKHTNPVPIAVHPFLVGLTVTGIGLSYGDNCGYAINPARDLGPRMFTYLIGWGKMVFSYNNYRWFWIPLLGPYIGSVLGAFVYHMAIGYHWPEAKEKRDKAAASNKRKQKRKSGRNTTTTRDVDIDSSLHGVPSIDNSYALTVTPSY